MVAPIVGRSGDRGEMLIEHTDPFSRAEGKTPGEFLRQAIATCPPLSFGKQAVANRILGEGWVIESGDHPGKDSEELRAWTAAWMGRRSLRLTSILPVLTEYLFAGWAPYNVTWEDWTWRTAGKSKRFKVPSRIIEKDDRLFRFNLNRDLVYIGYGADRNVFPITAKGTPGDEARMRWLTPRRGSEDVPYGRGIMRESGAAAAYLLWRDLWKKWQTGVDRSMGILIAERVAGTVGARLSDAELIDQLQAAVEFMNSTGIIAPPEGMNLSWMENTAAYSDGWKDPLDRLEALIALSVTGQGLSIGMGRGGSSGSRSAVEVEEGRSGRWGRGYATDLAESITCLSDLAISWNWGEVPDDMRPKMVFRSSRHVDPDKLQIYVDLAQDDPNADPPDWQAIADEWTIPTRRGAEWSSSRAVPNIPTESPSLAGKGEEAQDEGAEVAA